MRLSVRGSCSSSPISLLYGSTVMCVSLGLNRKERWRFEKELNLFLAVKGDSSLPIMGESVSTLLG